MDNPETVRRFYSVPNCRVSALARAIADLEPVLPKKKRPVMFLDIPPEIRVEIYKYLLWSRDQVIWNGHVLPDGTHSRSLICCRRIIITTPKPYDYIDGKPMPNRPFHHCLGPDQEPKANILRTCRTVYNEAILYLYRDNEFGFEDDFVAVGFLDRISLRNRQLIPSIAVGWYWVGHRPDTFTGMRTIVKRPARPHADFMRQVLLATWCSTRKAQWVRMHESGQSPTQVCRQQYPLVTSTGVTLLSEWVRSHKDEMGGLKELRVQMHDAAVRKELKRLRKQAQRWGGPKRYWPGKKPQASFADAFDDLNI